MRHNRLEAQILSSVDEVVQCAISAGLKSGSEREEEIARGVALVKQMGDLLAEALEGRTEHLQTLLEQLVAQRLPERRVLQSFGNFSRDLQEIITRGIAEYTAGKELSEEGREVGLPPEQELTETAEEKTAADEALPEAEAEVRLTGREAPESEVLPPTSGPAPLKRLRLALERAYPGEEIIEDFATRGGRLAFYLPGRNLGLELASTEQDWRKEFFYRRAGITVIKVSEKDLENPLSLARRLRLLRLSCAPGK